ncbi:MAG: hypothetical protein U5N53_00530 [Mycobacterium sp.]|nr:hypothetical protein [Mycobacterium sp.]
MASRSRPEVRALIDAVNLGDTDVFLAAFTLHLSVVDDWAQKFHGARTSGVGVMPSSSEKR